MAGDVESAGLGGSREILAGSKSSPLLPHWGAELALFAAIVFGALAVQHRFSPLIGSDGFFHAAIAQRGPWAEMPWMPLSVFGEGWVDHQWLFHLALWPFVTVFDPVTGTKTAAAIFAGIAVFALYRFLRAESAPAPLLFALAPAALSWHFILRMEMPRAGALSLAWMVLSLSALSRGQNRRVFLLSWGYLWTYHVALALLPIAVLHAVIDRFTRSHRTGAAAWRGVGAVFAGLLAGLCLHPHSPHTVEFAFQHVVLKVLNAGSLPVGLEWRDGTWANWLGLGWPALVALGLGVAALARARSRRSGVAILFGSCAAAAQAAALIGTRFHEYALPFAVLFLALSLRDLDPPAPRIGSARARHVAAGVLALGLVLSHDTVVQTVRATEPDPMRLAPAMRWLDGQAPDGSRIFHFEWNDFPELSFHGPQFEYIVGLDPHFLALEDPELWDLYTKIGRGWGRNPSKPIGERFGATWALLVKPYAGATTVLDGDEGLVLAYEDEATLIYRVAPASPGASN